MISGLASAQSFDRRALPEPDSQVLQNPVSDHREGGETIADAVQILANPFADSGNTCPHDDDYDAVCPFEGMARDVVYSLFVPADIRLTVDLCGSSYDTKTYVYSANLDVPVCNDDYYFDDVCGVYVSKIDRAFIAGGQMIFIVVDGYSTHCGQYELEVLVEAYAPCELECPCGDPWFCHENEPELQDGYQDTHNGGCNSPEFGTPFQDLWAYGPEHLDFCGISGWYDENTRDTDWFTIVLAPEGAGFIDCEIDAEQGTYLFELFPQDCEAVEVAQLVQVEGGCNPQTMTVFGAPGGLVWLWVRPDVYYPPPPFEGHEYDYVLTIDGLDGGVFPIESASWSAVKRLYR